MRKTLLLLPLLLLLSISLSSQNWMPWRTVDTVKHFITKESIQWKSVDHRQESYFRPLLSMVVDSIFQNSSNSTIIFKKGFAYINCEKWIFRQSRDLNQQIIKGKILGDTAWIFNDSSVFTSIDTNGFRLLFPHHYHSNMRWVLGSRQNERLIANVDSLFIDSVHNSIDSVASISIAVVNLSNSPISNSPFNGRISISKSNGLLNTFDFTSLDSAFRYEHYSWNSQRKKELLYNERVRLTKGDYFIRGRNNLWSPPSPYLPSGMTKYTIIEDTIIQNRRYLRYQRSDLIGSNYPYGNNGFSYSSIQVVDTIDIDFPMDSVYSTKYSGIIEDSLIDSRNWWFIYPFIDQFFLDSIYKNDFILSLDDPSLTANFLGAINFEPDSIYDDVFERDQETLHIDGIANHFFNWEFGDRYHHEVLYISAGNRSWGTQPSLLVGLEEKEIGSIRIFPNPVNDILTIQSQMPIDRMLIRDLNGKIILDNEFKEQISLEHLAPGIYFLQVINGEEAFSLKLIKR